MVRNTTGGSKTKSQARKSFVKSSDIRTSVRTPQNEFELIATVTKLLGNGMCYVSIPSFDHPLICHIRGKFRGRSKKHNIVNIGSTVLIGLRDWESPHFKNSDLLDILNSSLPPSSSSSSDLHDDLVSFSSSSSSDILSDTSLPTPQYIPLFDISEFDDI